MNGRVIIGEDVVVLPGGNSHFKAGDYVEFACNPGFIPTGLMVGGDGERMSICLPNGSWSLSPPECESH